MKIYLVSRSPRRRDLLQQIDVDYELVDVDIDESWDGTEAAEDYVCRISREKAETGFLQVEHKMPILAADTAVVLDNRVLGKAETVEQARDMLTRLSGKSHRVLSAITVIAEQERTLMNESVVRFRALLPEEIEDYCQSGEPIGKAGGYAIQGRAAVFIERLEGSYSGVMGLPLYETYELLAPLNVFRKQ